MITDPVADFLQTLDDEQRVVLAALPPQQRDAMIALAIKARPEASRSAVLKHNQPSYIDPVTFIQKNYFIPETRLPMVLQPHQEVILRYALDPAHNFQTIVYSTIKKSGKTAVAAAVARWVAETWGYGTEVYMIANDAEQARGRQYASFYKSLELTPGFQPQRQSLPGKWHVVAREARFHPFSSVLKALSGDFRGEAGSNPTSTFWSELWGFTSEASRRLYDELTPVPTRARSLRFIETYAGYEDESDLLLDVYRQGTVEGRQLTREDLAREGYIWPFDEQRDPDLPLWVNEQNRLFMYWDTWEEDEPLGARRMPWQVGPAADLYYKTQEASLRPEVFQRLHRNLWTSNTTAFLQIEWYDNCRRDIPALDPYTGVVIAVDGAVTSDCAAVVGVSRDPANPLNVMERFSKIWKPPRGGAINLAEIQAYLEEMIRQHNVICLTYDPYQMHKLMTDLAMNGVPLTDGSTLGIWTKSFDQGKTREIADKQFYDLIRERRFSHANGTLSEQRQHVSNAGAKTMLHEDSRMRIVKKTRDGKIDYTVAASMACAECLRLLL